LSQQNVRFVRSQKFIFRQIVDEMILVPLHKDVGDLDAIYTLNEVGAFLWSRMEYPITIPELQSAVLDSFDAQPDELVSDLGHFLSAMVDCGAVQRR